MVIVDTNKSKIYIKKTGLSEKIRVSYCLSVSHAEVGKNESAVTMRDKRRSKESSHCYDSGAADRLNSKVQPF